MYIMLGPIPLYILHTFFLNIFIRRDLLAHDLMMTVGKAEGQAQHSDGICQYDEYGQRHQTCELRPP